MKGKDNMHFGASRELFVRARELRVQMTESEQLLWEQLRDKKLDGYKFRRQHPIKKFILDFYCHSQKLGIEVDGGIHSNTVQKFYDEDRSYILLEIGIRIIRFSNSEVINDLDKVMEKIRIELSINNPQPLKGSTK